MRNRLHLLPAAAFLVLAMAGCAGMPGAASNSAADTAESSAPANPVPADPSAVSPDVTGDRSIVTTGWISMTGDAPIALADDIAELAESTGGHVSSRSDSAETASTAESASLTIRVPAEQVTSVLTELATIGSVTSTEVTSDDVTAQLTDYDVRIAGLEASIARLQDLMGSAEDLDALLQLEQSLTDRMTQLEQWQSERASLADNAALSTLHVSIAATEAVSDSPDSFFDGLAQGWTSLMDTGTGLLVALGFALPWLVLLALLGAAGWIVAKRLLRSRKAAATPVPAGTEETVPVSTS